MYVCTYRSKAAQMNIKNVVLDFYDSSDIATARQTLEDSVQHLIPACPVLGIKRTDSVNRTASAIMIDDIFDMLKALDNVKNKVIPRFMSADATKIPPSGPEAAGSLMAVMETVSSQQRDINQLKESLCALMSDYSKIKKDIENNQSTITAVAQSVENLGNTSVPVASQLKRTSETVTSGGCQGGPKSIQTEVTPGTSHDSRVPITSETPAGRSYVRAVTTPDGDDGFQSKVKRPNKGINKGLGKDNMKPKQARVVGTGESALLRAGPQSFQLQITNVNSDLNEDNIKEYIQSKDVEIQGIEDKTSEGWQTKRFLITFDYNHYEKVMATEFWPKKIYYKRWFPAKMKIQTQL